MKLDADYAELLADCSLMSLKGLTLESENKILVAEGLWAYDDESFLLQCRNINDRYFVIEAAGCSYGYPRPFEVRIDGNNLTEAREQVACSAVHHNSPEFLFLGLKIIEFLETLKGIMP